jgi:hypothetical protein
MQQDTQRKNDSPMDKLQELKDGDHFEDKLTSLVVKDDKEEEDLER